MNKHSDQSVERREAFDSEQRGVKNVAEAVTFFEHYYAQIKRNKRTGMIRVTYPDGSWEEVDNDAGLVEAAKRWPVPWTVLNMSSFSKFTSGYYGLARTYWGYYFLVGVMAIMLSAALVAGGAENLATLILLLFAGYSLVCMVAVWNAAGRYDGIRGMGLLARIAVVFGILNMLATCSKYGQGL